MNSKMMTTSIRNLNQASTMVRQLVVRQLVTGLIRQYGFDELMKGLRFVYRDEVYTRSRNNPTVQRRMCMLDEAVIEIFKEQECTK